MELKGILVNDDDGDVLQDTIIIIIITANAYFVLLYTRPVLSTSLHGLIEFSYKLLG